MRNGLISMKVFSCCISIIEIIDTANYVTKYSNEKEVDTTKDSGIASCSHIKY